VQTPDGPVQASRNVLTKTTVNRYLKCWGYDCETLNRPPPAVRFQARYSNECWHFDLSPSDLKQVERPEWFEEGRGHPLLMLYSVVDDRSGVAYQEYHGVYGEDVEAALRFLFAAMAPKSEESLSFQGIPSMLYLDNGPIAKSRVFRRVMDYLGIEVRTHMPQEKDGRKAVARAKGKVERPFRTVKEMHETLFHFHKPQTEREANTWLLRFLVRYNGMQHRSEPHSRLEDWLTNLPEGGLRTMCEWERFCTFARESERRRVGVDARIVIGTTEYGVDPDLAGEMVILWWGLFDNELYVEHGERRYGPYTPVGGPIPLHRYRRLKKTRIEKRAERVEALAARLELPRAALNGGQVALTKSADQTAPQVQPFRDPDPFQELRYPNTIVAKKAVASMLGIPLARLSEDRIAALDALCPRPWTSRPSRTSCTPTSRNHGEIEDMLGETMAYYGITRPLRAVGYFETEHHHRVLQELGAAIRRGGLIALCGIVGCGKTTLLARTRDTLQQQDEILVSRSLAVDKVHVNLRTLIMALFYDLSIEEEVKVPTQAEQRERRLLSLIGQRGRPVALFVDDAHDLNNQTLVQLKRLIELVREAGESLSVVLVGHPKLKNDMSNPGLEEIGARSTVFELDGIRGEQDAYIRWLLEQCATDEAETLISDEAIALLAGRLATPLQIEHYLTRAFEQAHEIAEKPVSAGLVDSVLAPGLDDLEPRLTRHGYNVKILAHELNVRQAEVRAFLRGTLPAGRTEEIHKQLLTKGIPA